MCPKSSPFFLALIFVVTLLPPSQSSAHSGGLDSNGCHAGSKPYHCHRSQAPAAPVKRKKVESSGYGDRDCGDFSSWREAQDFFEASGYGDPHRLDADNDGIACEALQ
jgi:hypothetical protein